MNYKIFFTSSIFSLLSYFFNNLYKISLIFSSFINKSFNLFYLYDIALCNIPSNAVILSSVFSIYVSHSYLN